MLTSGVDVWLNTPQPPLEASGTSGMKAAMNGVPSLSILDGWWIEGCIEGVTGWSIGSGEREAENAQNHSRDAAFLYDEAGTGDRAAVLSRPGVDLSMSCATQSRSTARFSTLIECCCNTS
jgi:glucan phosphorylase